MKILITSIVDLKKSQHNRPHQFVKHLSEKHEVTVLSINDWWKGGQDDLEAYSSEFDDVFKRIEYFYLTDKKVSPILQELLFKKKVKEVLKEDFDVHLNYSTLISGYVAAKKIKTIYDVADDLGAMIKDSPQIPRLLNEEEYKEKIAELYKNKELRHETGKAGREFAERGYSWETIVERLEDVLFWAAGR